MKLLPLPAQPPEAKFLVFVPAEPKERTLCWRVDNKQGVILGYVGWWSKWRRYSFYPLENTVYEEQCLHDIANFIEYKTKLHRCLRRAELITGRTIYTNEALAKVYEAAAQA